MTTVNAAPIAGLPAPVQNALDNLRDGPRQIRAVLDDYRQRVADESLQASHDTGLTSEGRERRMAAIREQAGQQAGAALDRVRASLDADHERVRRNLERNWPSPASGLEALLTRQAAWARSRSLLESSLGPRELLAETTDIEQLHSLREELPTWLRANTGRVRGRVTTHMIDERLAEVSGEHASAALTAAQAADAERAACEPLLKAVGAEVRNLADRSAFMNAAIAAEMERQRVLAGGELPMGDDGGNAA
jgi:hypothetical protein